MQKKLHHKFHTKLISYDQFMEYKLYDKNEGYYSAKKIKNYGELIISTSPIVHSAFGFTDCKIYICSLDFYEFPWYFLIDRNRRR